MAETKQVARLSTGGSSKELRKHFAIRAAIKIGGGGHQHSSCMADLRGISRMELGSPFYMGRNREEDAKSHVKRNGRWERRIITGDLEE